MATANPHSPQPTAQNEERTTHNAQRTLHATGHFHLDPIWLWDKSDGLERFRATVRSILGLMDRNPEMTVAASSAALYDYLRRVDPEMFERVVEQVRLGRWEPVGGGWVEPDEHVPSGEGYVRQLLLGQEFFARYLGRTSRVAWSPDSFGRYAQLPRLLAGAGLEFFAFKRPERSLKAVPDVFWWTAADGSRVLASHLAEYGTWGTSLPRHVARVARDLREPVRHGLLLYGVGDHGGGPTQENIDALRALQHNSAIPPIRFSTPEAYFEALLAQDATYPTVIDHLEQFAGTGCATFARLKRAFRRVENTLVAAEAAVAVQSQVASEERVKRSEKREVRKESIPHGPSLFSLLTPHSSLLTTAWSRVAFNHFHDVAAGTSIPEAYDSVFDELGEAGAIARDLTIEATHAIANRIDIPYKEGSIALVAFNFTGRPLRRFLLANVRAMELPGLPQDLTYTHVLTDEHGLPVPLQRVDVAAMPSDRLGFIADLPALGYRVFHLVPGPGEERAEHGGVTATDTTLENERYRLTLDPTSGAIASLRDKSLALEVFAGLAAAPLLLEDTGNAWGNRRFDRPADGVAFVPAAMRCTHHGPLMAAIHVEYALERNGVRTASTLAQEFRMYHALDWIDVRVSLNWRERGIALKLAFPVFIKQYAELTTEIPYATQMYPADGAEVPGQAWADVTGESNFTERGEKHWHGVTIAGTAAFSYAFEQRGGDQVVLSFIAARGNPFTYAPPEGAPEPAGGWMLEDAGFHEIEYRIVPHIGGWREGFAGQAAIDLNRPPVVMAESPHPGQLPQAGSLLTISHPNVVLGALKPAQDGDGLIARLYEAHGEQTADVAIDLLGTAWTSSFCPNEIKSFHLRPGVTSAPPEVDLLERTSRAN